MLRDLHARFSDINFWNMLSILSSNLVTEKEDKKVKKLSRDASTWLRLKAKNGIRNKFFFCPSRSLVLIQPGWNYNRGRPTDIYFLIFNRYKTAVSKALGPFSKGEIIQ